MMKPMLASAMTKITFEDCTNDAWVLEEKFDGQRVMVYKVGANLAAYSRPRGSNAGLPRILPTGILDALRQMPNGVYDGELVSPGGRSWDVARLDTKATQILVLFDALELMGVSIITRGTIERHAALAIAVAHHANNTDTVRIVVPEQVPVSMDAVQTIWARGGEGAILKRVAAPYQPGKRSKDWLKVKRAGSATLTVTGFEAGKRGPQSTFTLRTDDGQDTTVKVLTDALLADVNADPQSFIGRRVVIAYCELTDTGKFRHGVFDHFAGAGE